MAHQQELFTYPPNWETEIRPAIKNRSGNKCEWCGVEHGSIRWIGKNKKTNKTKWFHSQAEAFAWGDSYTTAKISTDGRVCSSSYPKRYRVILTTAHLDHDAKNWNVKLNRLAHLCVRCHFQYDHKNGNRRAN